MKKSTPLFTTRNITLLSFLAALTIILQVFGNFINFGVASINLSLVPIALGAMTLGPVGGAILGLLNGFVVLFSRDTMFWFYPLSGIGTVLVCLIKTTVAGMVAGFIFNAFKRRQKHELLGCFLASISVPIINTLLFSVGFLIFFRQMATDNGNPNVFTFLIISVIGINFLFEFTANSLLSSAIYSIYRYYNKKKTGYISSKEKPENIKDLEANEDEK